MRRSLSPFVVVCGLVPAASVHVRLMLQADLSRKKYWKSENLNPPST
jgi:hypothetical protein